ncbi:hypothetical protein [Cellulomonas sp. SLBN-39]|uniref:hypothetical protein n=1 Tax=Cellulomonas sp. SLBN-39 TaxID=2768446 RepID=UPI001154A048|nr:hypothetical protein [Cellulomonas sp. SLBN-39]TQL03964.1 hypothetical protein FBY24_3074 [Cellulomonas sp. SLBN-39]
MGRRRRPTAAGVCVPAVLVALVLASCAAASTTTAADPDAFVGMLAGSTADHDPVGSPEALAEMSDLVVAGTISAVTGGRLWGRGEDDPAANRSIVLNVTVTDVHVGTLPDGADGVVYVELPSPGGVEAQVYEEHLPADLAGVFFLVPAGEPGETTPIQDSTAGRPEGQPLFRTTNPQGIVLGVGDQARRLLEGTQLGEADLTQFLPDAERFPVAPGSTSEPDVPPG